METPSPFLFLTLRFRFHFADDGRSRVGAVRGHTLQPCPFIRRAIQTSADCFSNKPEHPLRLWFGAGAILISLEVSKPMPSVAG